MAKGKRRYHCALCQQWFKKQEMSEEHFPAKTVGNVDMVEVNLADMIDPELAKLNAMKFISLMDSGQDYEKALDMVFEESLVKKSYPKGRTKRTLCRQCNTLLGKYDFSYKKFFEKDGNVEIIKGFQKHTKIQIIKAIYGKFLSIPECEKEMNFWDILNDSYEFIPVSKKSGGYHGQLLLSQLWESD